MGEKQKHKLLKQQAKQILKNEGFKDSEIFFEYSIKLENGRHILIDVVGINNQKKVFIECGNLVLKDRLGTLKKYCDKFIYIPYLNLIYKDFSKNILQKTKLDLNLDVDIEITMKNKKITDIGGSKGFIVDRIYIKNGQLDTDKEYDIIIIPSNKRGSKPSGSEPLLNSPCHSAPNAEEVSNGVDIQNGYMIKRRPNIKQLLKEVDKDG